MPTLLLKQEKQKHSHQWFDVWQSVTNHWIQTFHWLSWSASTLQYKPTGTKQKNNDLIGDVDQNSPLNKVLFCFRYWKLFGTILKDNSLAHATIPTIHMSQLMGLWYLSHRRPAKAEASLCICIVLPEPSLFAHRKHRSRQKVWLKIRHLAPLDGCVCAFEEWVYGARKVP